MKVRQKNNPSFGINLKIEDKGGWFTKNSIKYFTERAATIGTKEDTILYTVGAKYKSKGEADFYERTLTTNIAGKKAFESTKCNDPEAPFFHAVAFLDNFLSYLKKEQARKQKNLQK